MNKTTKSAKEGAAFCFLLFSAAMTASEGCALAQVSEASPPPVKMHVRVYDYIQVPSKVLAMAEGQAGMIFREAGGLKAGSMGSGRAYASPQRRPPKPLRRGFSHFRYVGTALYSTLPTYSCFPVCQQRVGASA